MAVDSLFLGVEPRLSSLIDRSSAEPPSLLRLFNRAMWKEEDLTAVINARHRCKMQDAETGRGNSRGSSGDQKLG